jgi:hypothetical protein
MPRIITIVRIDRAIYESLTLHHFTSRVVTVRVLPLVAPTNRARSEGPRVRGHTRAESTRRSRQQHVGAGRVGRSRASYRADAHRLGKRQPGAAGFGEALHDLLPVAGCGVPERDPTVEIDSFERTGRRVALRPPGIGQVLLRRVRDAARRQEEGAPPRAEGDRFQRTQGCPCRSSMRNSAQRLELAE